MKLILRPEAERDLEVGYEWYEERQPGLGLRFIAAIRRQCQHILELPGAYPEVHPRLRRSLVREFPYAIFYLLRDDTVVVICVSQQAQHPDHWRTRL